MARSIDQFAVTLSTSGRTQVFCRGEVDIDGSSGVLPETDSLGLTFREIPRAALFLAGRAFVKYRRDGGTKGNVLSDFFIGAHAAVIGCEVLTRDG